MSRSSQKKEKHKKRSEHFLDDRNEGDAARTRPLSFDEIMISRKNKNLSKHMKEDDMEVGNIPGDLTFENAFDDHESGRHHRHQKDSSPSFDMHTSDPEKKENYILKKHQYSSRWKDEESCAETKLEKDYAAKSNHRRTLKSEIIFKDRSPGVEKGSRGSEIKFKAESPKETSSKAKGKSEILISSQVRIRDRSIVDPRAEATKKHSRYISGKDGSASRTREKSERENKRKHRNDDDEKNRDKSASKKVDLCKGRGLNVSEREERRRPSKSRHGELNLKKRLSRSREREDMNRRSISLSPRALKRASKYDQEHEKLPSHSAKSRSGRQHSGTDRSKVINNGSSAHYRRHGGSTSGLGGYSPRKRKSEAAIKTPSPIDRSPEKKSAKWDVALGETYSIPLNVQRCTMSSIAHEVVRSGPSTSIMVKPHAGTSHDASLAKSNVSIDSVQLTQANRPKRRLCIENVPDSASEEALMEFLNNLLLPSVANHIHKSPSCISCAIQREKCLALVEFLTADDASAALACDGCSFSGSILNFKRPKEFVEVASGEAEKAVASIDSISSVVKDSLHKIFIGGISKALSSEMVMEIACAFGPLKAYCFEVNDDHEEPHAFLEYVDQSVTLKAIAGLRGMKLGGQVLTAVQAVLDVSVMDNSGNPPFYGIPEHALPLLKIPTEVLKIKNVFNLEGFSSLCELEVEEVLKDVRLECARFGTVKSVNVVKHGDSPINIVKSWGGKENTAPAGVGQNMMGDGTFEKGESLEEVTDQQSTKSNGLEFPNESSEVTELGNNIEDDMPAGETVRDNTLQLGKLDADRASEDQSRDSASDVVSQEALDQSNPLKEESFAHDDKVTSNIQIEERENKSSAKEELNLEKVNKKSPEASGEAATYVELQSCAIENCDNENQDPDPRHVFEPGCVFVEYRRREASCPAAHSLHMRLFDDRIVTVDYVPLDLYRARFPK